MEIFPIDTTFVTSLIKSTNDRGWIVSEKTNAITELYQIDIR